MKTNPIATLAAVLSAAVLVMGPGLTQAATVKKAVKSASASKAKTVKSRSAGKNLGVGVGVGAAAAAVAAQAALTPDELALAERVHVGRIPCELGASVTVTPDPTAPGYFQMQGRNFSYRMFPVMTSTGAVRLEDPKAGAVWLQLGNKSMLMNQKQGVRLADECMSPDQMMMAQALKVNPAASILDPVRPAAAVQPVAIGVQPGSVIVQPISIGAQPGAVPVSMPATVPGQAQPAPADALMQLVPAAQ
jgi:hypothetical protein